MLRRGKKKAVRFFLQRWFEHFAMYISFSPLLFSFWLSETSKQKKKKKSAHERFRILSGRHRTLTFSVVFPTQILQKPIVSIGEQCFSERAAASLSRRSSRSASHRRLGTRLRSCPTRRFSRTSFSFTAQRVFSRYSTAGRRTPLLRLRSPRLVARTLGWRTPLHRCRPRRQQEGPPEKQLGAAPHLRKRRRLAQSYWATRSPVRLFPPSTRWTSAIHRRLS